MSASAQPQKIIFDCPNCGQPGQSTTLRDGAETTCPKCAFNFNILARPVAAPLPPSEPNPPAPALEAPADPAEKIEHAADVEDWFANALLWLAALAFLACLTAPAFNWGFTPAAITAATFTFGLILKMLAQLTYIRAALHRTIK